MNKILPEKEYQDFMIEQLQNIGYVVRQSDCFDRLFAMDKNV